MSSPNINFMANEKIRRRSTFQFIKECNELSKSTSSSHPDGVSPNFVASVYHHLHAIDNLKEFGPHSKDQSIPIVSTRLSSISKNVSDLCSSPITSARSKVSSCPPSSAVRVNLGKNSFGSCQQSCNDTICSGHNSAMEHLKSPAGTKLPHNESNATSGPGLAKSIGHTLLSDRKTGSNPSCTASAKGDHVCAIENGGMEDDASCSDDNSILFDEDDDPSGDESSIRGGNRHEKPMIIDMVCFLVDLKYLSTATIFQSMESNPNIASGAW